MTTITPKRKYRGTAQAEVAALTRQRIMESALALYADRWIDEVRLDEIAEAAGVTVQTILRHFGSKEGLIGAASKHYNDAGYNPRDATIAGDLDSIITQLTDHYEELGDRVFRILAQEEIVPQLKEFLNEGRGYHRRWTARVFEPWISAAPEAQRPRMTNELIAVCDAYVWKLFRRDMGLTREEYRDTVTDMLNALLNRYSKG